MTPLKFEPDHDTAEAFDDPQPGDRFHEMASHWVIVVAVEDGRVTALAGAGPLNWERGRIQGSGELVEPFQERAQVRDFASVEAFKAAYAYGTIPGYSVRLADRGNDVTAAIEHLRTRKPAPADPVVETPDAPPEPRELAERVIRDHVAEIDRYDVGVFIGTTYPRMPGKELKALRDQIAALIAKGDYTIVFAREGE